MWRVIGGVSLVFKLWMLVDAVRRDAQGRWMWVITVLPFGEWVYFFAVKLRDPGGRQIVNRLRARLAPRLGVAELRRRLERTPCVANQVQLAQALYDEAAYEEAHALFAEVLAARPDDVAARYGLGLCRLELHDDRGAIEALGRLVEARSMYRDYAAYPALAEAHFGAGEAELGVEVMRELYRQAPRLGHALALAQALRRAGEREEAARVLERALTDRDEDPWRARLRTWSEAQAARAMLRDLAPAAVPASQ
ncbi:MAG: tetratricopeptide repeat protein [Myxococcales bacterium]|nr:tetratricopeptide repeat protein [Myxococcales bacterium]